ncbi:hypothetical protein ABZY81_41235 [Streptomyces sp. NPDC006514]|uniref:hypothetical protein n=1 Tax=Streptomyces sp. NPDC006514 TaxID=3154308 RepID=UPI0033A60106
MRTHETSTWGTTPQSHDGKRFFSSMRKSASCTRRAGLCEHMLAVCGAGLGRPQPEPALPL